MYAKGFLHKLLSSVMHKKRIDTLILLVTTLLISKKLSLTGLARNINSSRLIQERSNIRRVDRFLGNKKLQEDLKLISQSYVLRLIGNMKRPKIIVDWSQIPNTEHYLLRAALANEGRGIVLYEEVHHQDKLGNEKIQCQFLNSLKEFLPSADCKAIIITDAGFYNSWFKHVLKVGWDFIGRVRGLHTYFNGECWKKCKDLHQKASTTPQCISNVWLCKKKSVLVDLVVVKENLKIKSRHCKKKRGGGKDVFHYRNSAKEPWVIATSVSGIGWIHSKRIIKFYKFRMQIEEGFRDLKHGFNLRHAYSKIKERIQILLLIGMLATLVAFLVGYIAEKNKWHYKFQTNSIKTRRVLSWFFLGCQVIKQNIKIPKKELDNALYKLQVVYDA